MTDLSTANKNNQPTPDPEVAPDHADLGVLRNYIGFRLRRIQNHLSRTLLAKMEKQDIKSGMFTSLALISANPGISQVELSREGGFDKAMVVYIIDELENRGWVIRHRSATDRRRYALQITPSGEEALDMLLAAVRENEAPLNTSLTAAEIADLYSLLDRIYDLCFRNKSLIK